MEVDLEKIAPVALPLLLHNLHKSAQGCVDFHRDRREQGASGEEAQSPSTECNRGQRDPDPLAQL